MNSFRKKNGFKGLQLQHHDWAPLTPRVVVQCKRAHVCIACVNDRH